MAYSACPFRAAEAALGADQVLAAAVGQASAVGHCHSERDRTSLALRALWIPDNHQYVAYMQWLRAARTQAVLGAWYLGRLHGLFVDGLQQQSQRQCMHAVCRFCGVVTYKIANAASQRPNTFPSKHTACLSMNGPLRSLRGSEGSMVVSWLVVAQTPSCRPYVGELILLLGCKEPVALHCGSGVLHCSMQHASF